MSPFASPPLFTWALKGWPSNRLALALDATSLGDRFTVLSLSILYRGSACPVAWKIMQANVRHAWKPEWIALLRLVQPLVPAGWTVIVLTDRGLRLGGLVILFVARGGLRRGIGGALSPRRIQQVRTPGWPVRAKLCHAIVLARSDSALFAACRVTLEYALETKQPRSSLPLAVFICSNWPRFRDRSHSR